MKIGMILDVAFPPDPRVEREALALVNAGHQVYILCLNFTDQVSYEIYKGIHIIRHSMPKKMFNKLRPTAVNYPFYNLFWKKKIFRFISDNNIKILHVHDLPLMSLSLRVTRKKGIKIVGDFHENYSEAMKMYDWVNTLQGKVFINHTKWEKAQRFVIDNLDKIVVCAEEAVDIFNQKYNRPRSDFHIVENTIDIEQFMQSGIDKNLDKQLKEKYKEKIVFGYIGGVIPNRGIQHLIYILSELRDLNIKIVIVGRGNLIADFKKYLNKHNISDLVDWYDWQPFNLVATFISNFDIGITRLEQNLQNDATTANKVFQYMYMEKPVLTADSLPMRRIVEETNSGIVFKSGDSKALKDAVIKLYDSKDLRNQLGKNGKQAVLNKFNWQHTANALVKFYNSIQEEIAG